MSNIVRLKDFSERSLPGRPSAEKPEGPAQILFFLGVRYCHEEDGGGHPDGAKIGPRVRAARRAPRRKRA